MSNEFFDEPLATREAYISTLVAGATKVVEGLALGVGDQTEVIFDLVPTDLQDDPEEARIVAEGALIEMVNKDHLNAHDPRTIRNLRFKETYWVTGVPVGEEVKYVYAHETRSAQPTASEKELGPAGVTLTFHRYPPDAYQELMLQERQAALKAKRTGRGLSTLRGKA